MRGITPSVSLFGVCGLGLKHLIDVHLVSAHLSDAEVVGVGLGIFGVFLDNVPLPCLVDKCVKVIAELVFRGNGLFLKGCDCIPSFGVFLFGNRVFLWNVFGNASFDLLNILGGLLILVRGNFGVNSLFVINVLCGIAVGL